MTDNKFQILVKKDYKLDGLTTYKIGGKAKYFVELSNYSEIIEILEYCHKANIKYFVLGGGSNILFSDEMFDGLVIKIGNNKYKFKGNNATVDAGVRLQDIVQKSAKRGLSGLEYLAGIPGSIGGAIRGNAGAYGHEISEVVEYVNVIKENFGKFELIKLSKEDLSFSYRSSTIKEREYIVIDTLLKLKISNPEKVQKIVKDIIKERNTKQPYNYPSAGCVFKNITECSNKNLKKFEIHNKIPVAKIIEELGLKGRSIGGAKVSEKHSNFIINKGNAKAEDIIKLIKVIKEKVKQNYGIELEEEIKIIK